MQTLSPAAPKVPTRPPARPCWCGNAAAALGRFSDEYVRCAACETLVAADATTCPDPRVRDDASDLYGRQYWFSHQKDLYGQADIHARARADLGERCVYWLNALTRLILPPARVLELGCAHGGLVHLLRQAGFDAEGSELSPAICQIARETFGVPMRQGPVEDQDLPAGSLDAVVLMDVLEHLPHPVATMQAAARLLKGDGFLLIQTPCYPAEETFESLAGRQDRFLAQLKPLEHLYLFSRSSAERLMQAVGLPHVAFLPAIYPFYDMFFVASRRPIPPVDDARRWAHLSRTPGLRLVQAMLDAEDRFRDLLDKHRKLIAERR